MYGIICTTLLMKSICYTAQSQPFDKIYEYFQKPLRNLDPQLMDEVLEYAPHEIKDVIETINTPDREESVRIMLVGSPGVGKTTLAQAVALQTGMPCYIVRAPSLGNQYQFSGEQNLIAAINPLLEKKESCIVIIDEIDALKQYRGDKTNQDASPANTLCNLLDDAEDYPHIVFIATTNKLKQVPEDLKSRFGTIVTLPLPNETAREHIIRYHLNRIKKSGIKVVFDDNRIKQLAKGTNGFSAREIRTMVLKAKIKAHRTRNILQEQSILDAYKEVKPMTGTAWHIRETFKEFVMEHGVGITLGVASTTVAIIGLILSECNNRKNIIHQKKLELDNRKDHLIDNILNLQRMVQDYEIEKNRCELMCCQCAEMYYKTKLAETFVRKDSNEAAYLHAKRRFLLQQTQALQAERLSSTIKKENEAYVNKAWKNLPLHKRVCLGSLWYYESDELHTRITEFVQEEAKKQYAELLKKQKAYIRSCLATQLSMSAQQLDALEKATEEDKYMAKIDLKVTLAARNIRAREINEANERAKASARERRESRVERLIMGGAETAVQAVGNVLISKLLTY